MEAPFQRCFYKFANPLKFVNQMKTIISKRHPVQFYGILIFISLFFGGIGTVLLLGVKDAFFGILLCYFFVIWIVFSFFKNTSNIIINEQTISFGNCLFSLSDIKEVKFTGKKHFRYLFFTYMESAKLIFKDGTEKIIFDNMYANSAEMKSFLKQVIIDKQEYKPYQVAKPYKSNIQFEPEEQFKGNPFLSFTGVMLWGFIAFLGYLLFFKANSNFSFVFIGILGLFWFVFHSWMMCYFGLTKNYLIVRNHHFIWMIKIYKLSDIHEIAYETYPKGPNCMRIITRDFKSKLYRAAPLRDKTWLELKDKLEAKGVEVRNECIYR